ncbi:hypothetical protein JW805_10935 [Roseomonas aeriglobus]|nr:hypothetical protein [Roseomonas aeriglobus]
MDRFSFVAGSSAYDAPHMPAGTRVRYFPPAPALAPFLTAYNAYGAVDRTPRVDPFLPMMTMVTILVDAGPVSVRVRNHVYDDVPPVALYGAMTRPIVATTHGGVQIGIGISPLGWARLVRRSAEDFHNRLVPLGSLFGPGWGERVHAELIAAESDEAIPDILDRHFAPLLTCPHPQEALIARLAAIVAGPSTPDIATLAEEMGVTTITLRRFARRYFGMPPKQMVLRARFLRSFLRESGLDGGPPGRSIADSYFDESHYLRDAHTFLGTTPKRFLRQPLDFLRGSVASRIRALGAAAQVLHHVDPPALTDAKAAPVVPGPTDRWPPPAPELADPLPPPRS